MTDQLLWSLVSAAMLIGAILLLFSIVMGMERTSDVLKRKRERLKEKGNLLPTLRYAWLVVRHKWFVFVAGIRTGCPLWRLVTHDLSKFGWAELPHYGRQFFGEADQPDRLIECWIHHQNHNDHHWEYWIPRTGHNRCTPPYPAGEPVVMPMAAVQEMVADWLGAGRAYEGRWPEPGGWSWLQHYFKDIARNIAPGTRDKLLIVMKRAGYEEDFAKARGRSLKEKLDGYAKLIDEVEAVRYTGYYALIQFGEDSRPRCMGVVHADEVELDEEHLWDLLLPIPEPDSVPEFDGW